MNDLNLPSPDESQRNMGMALYRAAERANQAEAALSRVREMHVRIMGPTEVGQPGSERCDACLEIYPCPTIREINRSTSE